MDFCLSCPRKCRVDRTAGQRGYCGVGYEYVVAKADLHMWEEPCISGKSGSGAIFFSGCNLRCVYCQNRDISRAEVGSICSEDELIDKMCELESRGANNINLVTPTPYAGRLAKTLEKARLKISVPIVYNCGGYEALESLESLDGLVDVYLPDFKYFSPALSLEYSSASDYAQRAAEAIAEMYRQVGEYKESKFGIVQKGVIVRHLILPACRKDSFSVLDLISKVLPVDKIKVSIMCQYTPDFAISASQNNLHRRVTSFEYASVLDYALKLGFDGFSQDRSSATSAYTPDFLD